MEYKQNDAVSVLKISWKPVFFFFLSPAHLEFSYTSLKQVMRQFSKKKLTNPMGNPIQENGEGDSNIGVNGNNRITAVQQVRGLKEHL